MPVENASYGVSEGTWELYPADVYDCKLTDITRKTLPVTGDDGVTIQADFLEFEFTIEGGEFDGKLITDVAREYASLGPRAKMRGWIEGMTGVSLLGRTTPVDPNRLIGRHARVNLSRGPNQKGRDCNKIVSLLPVKKTTAAPVAPKPVAVAAQQNEGDNGELF
jgi:hypothetical protein